MPRGRPTKMTAAAWTDAAAALHIPLGKRRRRFIELAEKHSISLTTFRVAVRKLQRAAA